MFYIEVVEEPSLDKPTKWGICLGSPNPDVTHYIETPTKELAFELRNKLNWYLQEIEKRIYEPQESKKL